MCRLEVCAATITFSTDHLQFKRSFGEFLSVFRSAGRHRHKKSDRRICLAAPPYTEPVHYIWIEQRVFFSLEKFKYFKSR